MKKTIFAILTIALLLPGAKMSAQGKYGADSAECIKYLSYYSEYYKQKNYDEALPNWRKAYNLCPPTASQNLSSRSYPRPRMPRLSAQSSTRS